MICFENNMEKTQNFLWGGFKRRKLNKIVMVNGGHCSTFIISSLTIRTRRVFPDHIAKGC